MSYQADRDQFIARMTAEGLPLPASQTLLRCATSIQRYAELACSSEAADRDRVPCPASTKANSHHPCLCDRPDDGHATIPRIRLQDWRAEQRAMAAVTKVNDAILMSGAAIDVGNPALWRILTSGDPRGYTLRVIPPSWAARNEGRDAHNLDAIGVPARESRWSRIAD